ncbi:uncharacterized protein LOC112577273 [Pomacea canaliculata]|uniref:uncharacterized protein LOC112577273 n=1 Tax=Pomacea canaliculata TaxID=400727 RepID=UPI000D739B90|nr:uncharacterized protein LOC112577273 [Pomacea canaliculata]XP_025116112.1 uncharacterized protein LOC112577273 [Pomacea canaliculata]
MGKNKGRGGGQKKNFKKDPIAVKVAGVRKSKTKAVNSSLKKINFQNRSKTEKLDSQMSELQTGKKSEKRPASKPATKVNMSSDAPPPDINMAADELSKLTS